MTEADNLRRGRPGTYEVWYLTFNDPKTGDGFWIRHVIEPTYAEVWFARFGGSRTFGIHRRFPLAAVTSHDAPFEIAIGDSRLRHDGASGRIAGAAWDLRWQPARAPMRLLPDLSYRLGIGETTVVSPNPRVAATGTLIVDGERYELSGVALGQTHLWGTRHARSWTWARCAFDDEPDLLELLGVRLARRGVMTPPLVMVRFGDHALNQFRHVALNRARWDTGRMSFTARGAAVKLEGEFTCRPDQLLLAPYLDPDGTEVFCANTEIGDCRLVESRRTLTGWRHHRTLTSRGRAHFETGGRTRDPRVTLEHHLV